MLKSISRLALAASGAAVAAFAVASAATAAPSNLGAAHGAVAKGAVAKDVIQVHGDWDDDDGSEHRRWHRHHRGRHHVDAPFTHVESGRRVVVDAPFAHVYVGRHGRHVVAPFVNLWLPR